MPLIAPALVSLLVAASGAGDAGDARPPPALIGAAVQATEDGRYCDALHFFAAVQQRWPSARTLYNAAEVANAAGDRARAIDLYRESLRLYPDFEKKDVVEERLGRAYRLMQKEGPGTPCRARADVCGDWLVGAGETCDDGNNVSDAECDSNCTIPACGNGVTAGGEQCDDGNRDNGDTCDENCTLPACGNGVRTGDELCDDGNNVDGDGCDRTCTPTACGNGVRTGAEECDDGNTVNGDGCDQGCLIPRCGNGVTAGLEICDDGNSNDGDGCEHDCSITRRPAPLFGTVVASVGGAALLAGGGLVVVGSNSLVRYLGARRRLEVLESDFGRDPTGALAGVDSARDEVDAKGDDWRSVGLLSLVGGSVLTLAGVGAIGTGTWLAVTQTEEAPR